MSAQILKAASRLPLDCVLLFNKRVLHKETLLCAKPLQDDVATMNKMNTIVTSLPPERLRFVLSAHLS